MLPDFTRGLAASLAGDLAAGQVLLRDVIERISVPPLRDDPRSLFFLGLAAGSSVTHARPWHWAPIS